MLLVACEWASAASIPPEGPHDQEEPIASESSAVGVAAAAATAAATAAAHTASSAAAAAESGRTQLDVAQEAWEAQEAAGGSSARAPLRQIDSLFSWWEQVR